MWVLWLLKMRISLDVASWAGVGWAHEPYLRISLVNHCFKSFLGTRFSNVEYNHIAVQVICRIHFMLQSWKSISLAATPGVPFGSWEPTFWKGKRRITMKATLKEPFQME